MPDKNKGNVHDLQTVPPPEGGDVYSSPTVICTPPDVIVEAIRKKRVEEAAASKARIAAAIAALPEASVPASMTDKEPQNDPASKQVAAAPVAEAPTPEEVAKVKRPKGIKPEPSVGAVKSNVTVPIEPKAPSAPAVAAAKSKSLTDALSKSETDKPNKKAEAATRRWHAFVLLVVVALAVAALMWKERVLHF